MNNIYEKFTNLYSLQKTLRFELIPQGKTLENMKTNHIIEDDEVRAVSYKQAKKLIDEYHKAFIDKCMESYSINSKDLSEYYKLYKDKNKDKKDFDKVKVNLRKGISNAFTKNELYKQIFSKEIITKILPTFYSDKEDTSVLDEFSRFYTYFSGYNENRKNMYVADEKSTAIAYRLINDNLPMFCENIEKFNYAKTVIGDKIKEVYDNLNEYIQVNDIEDMFNIEYFNEVLSQRGIDVYNTIIGGKSKDDGTKIKGLNEYINEYRQNNPSDKKISKLNMLYKQVLSNKETASFVIDKFGSDQEVLETIDKLSVNINNEVINGGLENLLKNIKSYDLSKIYVKNDISITNISQYLYDDWNTISHGIRDDYDVNFGVPNTQKKEENKKKFLKSKRNLSIEFLNTCTSNKENFTPVEKYFSDCIVGETKKENVFEKIKRTYDEIKSLIKSDYENNLKEDYDNIAKIKDYLDALKELQNFIKPLVAVRFDEEKDRDNKFYDELFKYWDTMLDITSVYNKVRNYVTGKPYSTSKIKINFNNPTLLNGWALGNEITNSSLLFRKNGYYYLGMINKEYNKCFEEYPSPVDESDILEKMVYLQAADPQKDVQNMMVIDGKTVKKNGRKDGDGENRQLEEFKCKYLPQNINRIRLTKSYSKLSENFNKKDLVDFIDYYKSRAVEYYSDFTFKFKKSEDYEDFGEFTNHINEQAYQIYFVNISERYINDLVEEGKLYLFQIYNKDFSEHSYGKPNLHTMYWKALFNEDNLKDVVYKLNGEAEIFYRQASIKRDITHPKNEKINNKNENNPRKQSVFEYDLIKDKRYTEDKFQFHVPISLNFKAKGISKINEYVNRAIKENDNNYIIGIDRGERHLLYLSLIDSHGKIVKQYTLNDIVNENNGIEYKTDYHKLLDYKEKEREKARESWQSIENIKNLKEGYLSQVINKITDLMIKYNAIVVLEDLNFGFMRGRQKFEKQVYQKFEKMLIDKLNYLVKKDINENEPGGLLHAYQLTNEFESFKKLGKQSGFLYYIPAWNTSKMDPVTGYVNFFYYVKYESEKSSKEFFKKFDNIKFNAERNYFEFDIDYSKFGNKAEGAKQKWTLCSYGDRVKSFRNPEKNSQWDSVEINITDCIKELLEQNNVDYKSEQLQEDILKITGKDFWEKFTNLFKLVIQMRNSITGTTTDYIISPVADENGEFFDSRKQIEGLPKDADANGAYNIARKGLWVIKQIKATPDDKLKNIKLAVSNKEWLEFIQNKEYDL